MPKLDGTGPEGQGSGSGRKLGRCTNDSNDEKLQKLGKGLMKRRKSGGGQGKGKRLKSGNQQD
ncbi:MAG: DUF5320 domain-containing protein [Lentimicrobiaceae bacterium]